MRSAAGYRRSLPYRVTPGHPFPSGFDDELKARRLVLEHCGDLVGEHAPVVMFGDSADAKLTAAVAIGLREKALAGTTSAPRLPTLAGQLLLSRRQTYDPGPYDGLHSRRARLSFKRI